jgi:hypothetical protein
MSVFVATSKRFYDEAEQFVERIKACDVMVHHPYFHLDPTAVDADPDYKSRVTLQHFPEIDDCEVLYALCPGGYIGCSVTIELAYAYAKGKAIIVSEPPTEFAVRALISDISSPDQFVTRLKRG